jgi:mannose-6-phosphate isomerase-like protein (cupin superfamily)
MSPPISVPHHLSQITRPFSQTLLATLDDSHEIKIALLDGPYVFHSHPNNDELFYIISGSLVIEIMDGGVSDADPEVEEVKMEKGDLYIVKQGVRHKPTGKMAQVMVIEKKGVLDGNGEIAKNIGGSRRNESSHL